MISKILWFLTAAIGGIYLTSDEGKNARMTLLERKSIFDPIVKDLRKQINKVLEGSKQVNSDEIRANINLLIKEAKTILIDLDFDKSVEVIRQAIIVASRKIREASEEVEAKPVEGTKK